MFIVRGRKRLFLIDVLYLLVREYILRSFCAHTIIGYQTGWRLDCFRTCGEMQSDAYPDQKPVCGSIPKILYAWAMDAPELKLPKGNLVRSKINSTLSLSPLSLYLCECECVCVCVCVCNIVISVCFIHPTPPVACLLCLYLIHSVDGHINKQQTTMIHM